MKEMGGFFFLFVFFGGAIKSSEADRARTEGERGKQLEAGRRSKNCHWRQKPEEVGERWGAAAGGGVKLNIKEEEEEDMSLTCGG